MMEMRKGEHSILTGIVCTSWKNVRETELSRKCPPEGVSLRKSRRSIRIPTWMILLQTLPDSWSELGRIFHPLFGFSRCQRVSRNAWELWRQVLRPSFLTDNGLFTRKVKQSTSPTRTERIRGDLLTFLVSYRGLEFLRMDEGSGSPLRAPTPPHLSGSWE